MDADVRQNTRVSAAETRLVRQVVDDLLGSPAFLPSLSKLLARAASPQASPFERYAGIALRDAGADQLPRNRAVQLIPPGDGHLARLALAGDATSEQRTRLQAVEGAVNRLCDVADALEDSGSADGESAAPRVAITRMGGGFLPTRPGWRSANIALPAIGRTEKPSVEYLSEVDWRSLEHIPVIARAVFQTSLLPNMHQAFMGAYGPVGSDWDVRTRLAATLERLELPLPVDYAFDCNVPGAHAAVIFRMPPLDAFPKHTPAASGTGLADTENRIRDARLCYCIRLSCLLAAACFGAGRVIEHAETTCHDETGSIALACTFTRSAFVRYTLAAIDSGALTSPGNRFDPNAVLACAAPTTALLGDSPNKASHHVRPESIRRAPHQDERPLPDDMQRLFHARRICDIDAQHYFGGAAEIIDEARLDSRDSLLAAIASLESVAHRLEAETAPPDDDANARPLVCSNPFERVAVSLLDDEATIGLQAQAYLETGDPAAVDPDNIPHYFRAPNALLQAHVGLADLYSRLGDFAGAEAQADGCLRLAPTSASAYYQMADVLAQQSRFEEAANVLTKGLIVAISERDCALLYYHLGLVLWKLGRKRESAAVQVYATSLAGEYAQKAATMVASLRKRDDMPVIVHASPLAAARDLSRARIPLAPSDEARTLVVHAAVGLSCANAPLAAAPYAAALARYFRNDPIIRATARSLQHGAQLS